YSLAHDCPRIVAERAGEARVAAAQHRRDRFRFDCAGGKYRLETSAVAADAHRTVGIDSEVAKMTGDTPRSAQHASRRENPSANARAQREHHGIPPAPRSAPCHFAR